LSEQTHLRQISFSAMFRLLRNASASGAFSTASSSMPDAVLPIGR
jgi:hypothetical protein